MLINVLITLLLVALNGFFVAAEFAIVKVRASQLELKAQGGSPAARLAVQIVANLDGYLAATQLGITLASLGLGWIGEPVVGELLSALFDLVGLQLSEETAHQISLPVAFTLITILHIVFGELAPKSLAIQRTETTTLVIAYPLQAFYFLFRPFIWVLNNIAALLLRGFGIEAAHSSEVHSADELKYLVHQSTEEGHIEDSNDSTDLTLVERAFEFSEKTVRQIMVPRTQMFGIDIDTFSEEILYELLQERYSRVPCYQDDFDTILGVIHLKELLIALHQSPTVDIHQFIKPVMFVPETRRIRPLLKDFQRQRRQMAIVVNEYGGTEGLITMEDILEELVGEIQDESDEEIPFVEQKSPDTYIVQAAHPLDEINEFLPRPLQKAGDYETLAGLLLHEFGRLPDVGEAAVLNQYEITILSKRGPAIERVQLVDRAK
ncbi:CBS domain containing-hemolysin-like protein [Larkinella arboricola]|uniref:CBS domain containing-hemolysin-like protein n=1 Tax=Larkinella arboricola TaxID=643671 RepID=A0A327X167_LARAB|nr:hemolysin family protein [Larkinella arboricola]RAK00126.1 CBS domain containing-hemolysin-like protein [Larkinella arboricola]